MDFIFIEGMRVDAHVGIYEREKAAPPALFTVHYNREH